MKVLILLLSLMLLMINGSLAVAFESKPGELLVKLKSDPASKAEFVFQNLALHLQRRLGLKSEVSVKMLLTTTRYVVLKLRNMNSEEKKLEAIHLLSTDPEVEYAEPNFIYHSSQATTPQDPEFAKLWGLQNSGQPAPEPSGTPTGTPSGPGTAGSDIHVVPAWSEGFTGSKSIRVAIIDTGIDYNHPDLKANVEAASGYNFSTNTADAMDDNNHGSHCAGTIGAVANNGIGVTGINWNVTLIPVKFLDSNGSGSADQALQAVQYATKLGVNVMSNSWGGGGYSQALYDAIAEARAKGILFVAAAGNDSNDNDIKTSYPAGYALDNIVSVAATDNKDQLAGFSNFGRTTVHVAAPGVKILSTVAHGKYEVLSGTSMATPHISGIAALLWSSNLSLTYAQVKDTLIRSSDPVRPLTRKVVSGGRANAYNALHGIFPKPMGPNERDWKDVAYHFETPHPYDNSKIYTYPIDVKGAKFIRVIFDRYDTESSFDLITLKQSNGEEIETMSGTGSNYVSDYLEGAHAEVTLTTDSTQVQSGFVVTHVQAIY